MWTKGAFLFFVFFLLCSLHNFDTKSVDRWTSTLKSLLKELGHLRTITILSSFDRDLRVSVRGQEQEEKATMNLTPETLVAHPFIQDVQLNKQINKIKIVPQNH